MIKYLLLLIYDDDITEACKAYVKQNFFGMSKLAEAIRFLKATNDVEDILKKKMPSKYANYIVGKFQKEIEHSLMFFYKLNKIQYQSEKK